MDQSNAKNYQSSEKDYFTAVEKYFYNSQSSYVEKMYAFTRFIPRQALSYFIVRNEIFQHVLRLHGSIFDFGVYRGASFFTWQQLSAIFEPYNHTRKIIGFDSFEGFSGFTDIDKSDEGFGFHLKRRGGMAFPEGTVELQHGITLLDMNRPVGHVTKANIVSGVLPEAFASYLDAHVETVVALANFGLGLYEPTLKTLELLKPRLQKGSILVFEDLNQAMWPGETKALYEIFSPGEIQLERNPVCPHLAYLIYLPK